jgi:repressor LexA
MKCLTGRQQEILDFIFSFFEEKQYGPSFQDIARQFNFKSVNAVTSHVRSLQKKGYLINEPNKPRSLRPVSWEREGEIGRGPEFLKTRLERAAGYAAAASTVELKEAWTPYSSSSSDPIETVQAPELWRIPVYGSIPAGFAEAKTQEMEGSVMVDPGWLHPRSMLASQKSETALRLYALRVSGDSMIGRHIVDGDTAILDPGLNPQPGNVVAALIDHETTLKTYATQPGSGVAYLKAENPKYPDLIADTEISIQGVLVGLIRRNP